MSTRPRILFVGEAVSLAHVSRPLVLAQALDPEQYDIHFACDARYRSLIEPHGQIHYWPLDSVPSKDFLEGVDRGGYIFERDVIEGYIAGEQSLYRSVEPTLVVSDLRFSVCVSAEAAGIASATIVNGQWSFYRDLGFDEFPFGDPPMAPSFAGRVKRKLRREMQRFSPSTAAPLDPNTTNFNAARRSRGLTQFGSFIELATRGDHVLYPEPEGFIRMKTVLPNHHFLGPILWSPDVEMPDWWRSWDTDRPLIYVTLGSTGLTTGLNDLVGNLSRLDATVVVTTAGRADLGAVPDNVFVADFLPGLDLCEQADVVVCNGGSATAYQALQKGTPVVGVWSNQDQFLTSTIIEQSGAGRGVRATESAGTITETVSAVLHDPAFATAAHSVSELFSSANAQQRFAAFVAATTSHTSTA